MDITTEHSHIGCHSDKWPRDVSSVKCYHGDLNTQMGIIESFNIVTERSGLWVVVLILQYVALKTKPESRDLSRITTANTRKVIIMQHIYFFY